MKSNKRDWHYFLNMYVLFGLVKGQTGYKCSQHIQNSQCDHHEEPPPDFLHCFQSAWAYNILSSSSHMGVVSL